MAKRSAEDKQKARDERTSSKSRKHEEEDTASRPGRSEPSGSGQSNGAKCFRCQEEGHIAKHCNKSEDSFTSAMKCYRCLEIGHKAKECTKDASELPADPEPEFGLSGALAAETNSVNGIARVYSEPTDCKLPIRGWRLYVFKNNSSANSKRPFIELYKQSAFLLGKDTRVVDLPTEHPSCSRQHAALQFRAPSTRTSAKPYIIDLGSTNGTHLNGKTVEPQRYYELLEKDVVRFGNSSREYVLLHEASASSGAAKER